MQSHTTLTGMKYPSGCEVGHDVGTPGRITAVKVWMDRTTDHYARNMGYWPSGASAVSPA